MNLDVSMQCTVAQDRSKLSLAFKLQNRCSHEIGLFNRLFTFLHDGTVAFPTDLAYIDFEAGTLSVRKCVLSLPEGLNMSERPIPAVSRVASGATYEERFDLHLPVPVSNPFRRAMLAAAAPDCEIAVDRPEHAANLWIEIGVFKPDPNTKFQPVSPAHPEIFRVWPPGPAVDGQVVLKERLTLSPAVPVLDYRAVPVATP